jgi:glycosyltransferase involved in cell wall biosynthesis
MTKIIYTGAFRFPDQDAAAARVLGIGKALRMAGHDVEFAGWEEQESEVDRQSDGSYAYEGFSYKSQDEFRQQQLSPVKRLFRYLSAGANTLRWLSKKDLKDVSVIIAYHGNSIFLLRLHSFCKKHGIRLIVDCTEWYAPSHLVGGSFGIVRLDNEIRMRLINTRIGWLIPISSYLEKYYARRGGCVFRMPPLVDMSDAKWFITENIRASGGPLRLVYAGTPAKKDLLGNVLRGLCTLRKEGILVELQLVGPSREDVANCINNDTGILEILGESLVLYGRVPQSEVPRLLARADFSVLLRPRERYSEAGFSTKLVESLASGVPVIANPTSDIAEFLTDGVQGILLADCSPDAFVAGVRIALSLSSGQKNNMRRSARRLAETSFDFRRYAVPLGKFIKDSTIDMTRS